MKLPIVEIPLIFIFLAVAIGGASAVNNALVSLARDNGLEGLEVLEGETSLSATGYMERFKRASDDICECSCQSVPCCCQCHVDGKPKACCCQTHGNNHGHLQARLRRQSGLTCSCPLPHPPPPPPKPLPCCEGLHTAMQASITGTQCRPCPPPPKPLPCCEGLHNGLQAELAGTQCRPCHGNNGHH